MFSVFGEATGEQGSKASKSEQEVQRLEKEYFDAFFRGDVATLERLLLDDYMQTDPRARVESKAEVLQAVSSREARGIKLLSYTMEDVAVRVYGNAAVLTALVTWTAQAAGQERTRSLRFTSVWVKGRRGWLRVAYQGTLVSEERSSRTLGDGVSARSFGAG